jgi:PAS domain S-box-containing protein
VLGETALRESEEQLRLAVENAEIGFWDVQEGHGELTWPPRTKAMFGISADVPVSMEDFYAGLHPDDLARVADAYAAAADPARRALYDVEYRTVGKEDGVIRWVAAKGRGIFDDDGGHARCLRVIGTIVDVMLT